MVLAVVAGGPVVGYDAARAAGQVIRHVMYIIFTLRRVIEIKATDVLRRYAAAATVATIVAAAIALVRLALLGLGVAPAGVLLAEMVTGAVTVAACIRNASSNTSRAIWSSDWAMPGLSGTAIGQIAS